MRPSALTMIPLVTLFACDSGSSEDVRGSYAVPSEATPLAPLETGGDVDIDCQVGPAFPNYWAGAIDDPDRVTSQPYDEAFDAGLEAVIDAFDDQSVAEVSLDVTDAVVANFTERDQRIELLWIADADGGIVMEAQALSLSADQLRPGDTVSFTATSGFADFGVPTILTVEDFRVTGDDALVYVVDGANTQVTVGAHLSQNIRASGVLVENTGTCGGSRICFTFRYGSNQAIFRVQDGFGFSEGDCVDVLAPLTQFSGDAQFNIDNNNWVSVY